MIACKAPTIAFCFESTAMQESERTIVTISAKAACLAWVNALPETKSPLTLKELQDDSTALLIPYAEDTNEAKIYIANISQCLFENELASWSEDEKLWPKTLDYDTFCEWFDVAIYNHVFDLASLDEQYQQAKALTAEVDL